MNKQKAILIASALFKNYPSVNKFHVTFDGQAFEKKHDAEAHASMQKKEEQEIFPISREDCQEGSASDSNGAGDGEGKKNGKK